MGSLGSPPAGEGILCTLNGPVVREVGQLGTQFVFQDAAGHAQLLEVGEIAEQGHVGIGRVSGAHALVVVPGFLGRSHQGQIGAQQHTLEVAARGGEAHIEAGLIGIGLGAGEEVVVALRARRRKHARLPAREECLDLGAGAAHRGRGSNDLGGWAIGIGPH